MASDTRAAPDINDVVVTLVTKGRTQAGFPERKVTLTRMQPTARVGRASKVSSKACLAAEDNAWFETPVMSRDHAELTADFDNKIVTLKDVGSLHGSYIRRRYSPQTEERVPAKSSVGLQNGDQIRFGIDIHRHHEKFPPCVVDFDMMWRSPPELAKKSPNTFSVPYGSDDEDPASDNDSVVVMEQGLPAVARNSNMVDLTTTESGAATPDRTFVPAPSSMTMRRDSKFVVDLTSEPDVDSDSSVEGRYSPVASSRKSLSTSIGPHEDDLSDCDEFHLDKEADAPDNEISHHDPGCPNNPMVEPVSVRTGFEDTIQQDVDTGALWSDCSEDDSDSNSQSSEDAETDNAPIEDGRSVMSEESARFTELSDEDTSDDSMLDSEIEDHHDDSDEDNDDLLPGVSKEVSVGPTGQYADSSDEDMTSDYDDESIFDERSPTSIWDKKSSPYAEPIDSFPATFPPNPNEVYYCNFTNPTGSYPQPVPQHQPVSQRQPSPSDAAMVKKPAPIPSSTAQALGPKTGKFEYFEARDHNRSLAAPPSTAPAAPGIISRLPDDLVHYPEHPDPEPSYNLAPWAGDDFINRPQSTQQLESLESRTRLQSPEPLDMTSAYHYQQSKSLRRIPIADILAEDSKEPSPAPLTSNSQPALIPIAGMLAHESREPSTALPAPTIQAMPDFEFIQPAMPSRKRSFDEVFAEVAQEIDCEDLLVEPLVPNASSTADNGATRVAERLDEARPTKRRRIVEFAACITLGGAAVLAGLITTAPQFS